MVTILFNDLVLILQLAKFHLVAVYGLFPFWVFILLNTYLNIVSVSIDGIHLFYFSSKFYANLQSIFEKGLIFALKFA